MLSKVKVQAKTVSEAINKGLRELNMRRNQVDVKILEHPKKGFLGFGSKPAIVEVRQKRWISEDFDENIYMDVPKRRSSHSRRGRKFSHGRTNSRSENKRKSSHVTSSHTAPRERTPKANEPQLLPCEAIQNAVIPENLVAPMKEAQEYLVNVLTHMGIQTENVHTWWDERQQRILVTFDCDKPAIVIGKEGKTLEALQYLATLAVTRHFDMPISVVADTQNYWRKSEDKINADIERAVDMIKHGASVFRFRPMSAQQRRYIHRAVEGNEYVTTASEGEGKWRKVTFRPTEKAISQIKANLAPADFVPGVIGEDIPTETPVCDAALDTQTARALGSSAACTCQEPSCSCEQQADTQTDGTCQTQPAATTVEEETPTQRMATQTVAATVTETVVETPSHTVVEHSVLVSTPAKSSGSSCAVVPAATEEAACTQTQPETQTLGK